MLIPSDFDRDRKKEAERRRNEALRTAQKLNRRLLVFMSHITKDSQLKESDRKSIRDELLRHL